MYSGITQGLYEVVALTRTPGLIKYTVQLSQKLSCALNIGDSVGIDGVCQTLIDLTDNQATFQAIQETLDKTTLNDLQLGNYVSVERSLKWGDEMGGHEVSGHVFGTGVIKNKFIEGDNVTLVIQCDPSWMKYILSKGFIAVDGSSLTVGDTNAEKGLFNLHLIPETLRLTNFANKKEQDRVNIEFDHKTKTIVDTVERVLAARLP